MKKILLACFLFIGLATLSRAQNGRVISADPHEKAKQLQKQIGLTDAQTEKITRIYRESAERYEVIRKENKGNSDKMMREMRPLRRTTIGKIKTCLKPRQIAAYDNLIKEDGSTGGNGWSDGWSGSGK